MSHVFINRLAQRGAVVSFTWISGPSEAPDGPGVRIDGWAPIIGAENGLKDHLDPNHAPLVLRLAP